ncbi:MAG TPA: hypothetical protein VK195_05010, partial [Burkholderiaceae bacterium]|nr:hypothetical protein [Burkholderiaceae bacterium]
MKATFPRLARWLTSQVSVLFTWSIVACVAPPAHALDLGLPGGGSSCDPTKMSCVPGGGGGSGGGICALFPDKPECKPGGGGGGGGTCTVPPGGSPTCGGSGPASTGGGGSAGVSVGGGNP